MKERQELQDNPLEPLLQSKVAELERLLFNAITAMGPGCDIEAVKKATLRVLDDNHVLIAQIQSMRFAIGPGAYCRAAMRFAIGPGAYCRAAPTSRPHDEAECCNCKHPYKTHYTGNACVARSQDPSGVYQCECSLFKPGP